MKELMIDAIMTRHDITSKLQRIHYYLMTQCDYDACLLVRHAQRTHYGNPLW